MEGGRSSGEVVFKTHIPRLYGVSLQRPWYDSPLYDWAAERTALLRAGLQVSGLAYPTKLYSRRTLISRSPKTRYVDVFANAVGRAKQRRFTGPRNRRKLDIVSGRWKMCSIAIVRCPWFSDSHVAQEGFEVFERLAGAESGHCQQGWRRHDSMLVCLISRFLELCRQLLTWLLHPEMLPVPFRRPFSRWRGRYKWPVWVEIGPLTTGKNQGRNFIFTSRSVMCRGVLIGCVGWSCSLYAAG